MRISIRTLATTTVVLTLALGTANAGDLRLLQAVKSGNLQAATALLAKNADVNVTEPDGATALHWAVNAENVPMTRLLLGAKAKVDAVNDYGMTPLLVAASGRTPEIVDALLTAGANPNTALPTGETALMTAARAGSVGAVTALLARGADPNARESVMGQTALMWAIVENHPDVVQALIAKGADIRGRTTGGFTPLLFAVREGRADLVRLLLDRGADVKDTDNDGSSTLHVAVLRGHLGIAKTLMARGADPNASKCGYAVLHWASGTWESIHSHDYVFNEAATNLGPEWGVLAGIADRGAKHDFIKALLSYGADINARITKPPPRFGYSLFKGNLTVGATPFYLASLVSDTATMRLLLANGADPAIPAADQTTPLIIAAGLARVPNETRVTEDQVMEGVTLMLSLGASTDASNAAGNTALHGATMAGLDHIVRYLVEQGANINAKNRKGATPLTLANGFEDSALFFTRPSTAALLKELGAVEQEMSTTIATPLDAGGSRPQGGPLKPVADPK